MLCCVKIWQALACTGVALDATLWTLYVSKCVLYPSKVRCWNAVSRSRCCVVLPDQIYFGTISGPKYIWSGIFWHHFWAERGDDHSLVFWLAYVFAGPRVRYGRHCMASTLLYLRCLSLSCSLSARSFSFYQEASTRTLVALDVDGWKGQFSAKNTTHI